MFVTVVFRIGCQNLPFFHCILLENMCLLCILIFLSETSLFTVPKGQSEEGTVLSSFALHVGCFLLMQFPWESRTHQKYFGRSYVFSLVESCCYNYARKMKLSVSLG